ncbi:transposase, partial [Aestuariivita sp.]|uniref:transposase n=1 Tax=Aestuariivita sp. TaxID=1872407 RepID=UPI00216EECB2
MDTGRFIITDRQWAKMEPHCLGLKAHPGRTGGDARLFLEAGFWGARTGAPWRGLPPGLGHWRKATCRFSQGGAGGGFLNLLIPFFIVKKNTK